MGNLALKQLGIGTLLNGNKSYGIVTGTVSGLRISNVAGAYFIDNCSALLPYSGCRVRFKDSGGKYFDCLMGLRGVSEGLGDNPSWASSINLTSGWVPMTGATINDADTFTTTGAISIYRGTVIVAGALYKRILSANTTSIGCELWHASSEKFGGAGDYATGRVGLANLHLKNLSAGVTDVLSLIFQQVLTPSNQGLLLTAAPTVDSGFLYNAASYTYEIWS
jgi:hypothetical protein